MSVTQDWPYTNNYSGTLGTTKVHGICATISAHWAKKTLKNGAPLPGRLDVPVHAMAAMHVVRTKEQGVVDAGGGDFNARVDTWHNVFCERLGMTAVRFASGSGTSYDLTSKTGVYLLTIYGAGGHTMAFARFPSRSVFFDPNFGQYSCPASIFSSFKKDVGDFVRSTYPTLHGEWFVYQVSLA